MLVTAEKARKIERVIAASRALVSSLYEFMPDYPFAVAERVQELDDALASLDAPHWEQLRDKQDATTFETRHWQCSNCGDQVVSFRRPDYLCKCSVPTEFEPLEEECKSL